MTSGSISDPGPPNEKRQKRKAIDALRTTGSKILAATAAQISREALDNWRKTDDEFQHDWDVAIQAYIAELKAVPIEQRAHYWHSEIPDNVAEAQAKLLVFLSIGYSRNGACAKLRISSGRLAKWLSEDADFQLAFNEAREAGNDFLEDAARSRGVDGVLKPVFYQGEHVANTLEFSDMLLDRLLRSRRASWRPSFTIAEAEPDNTLQVQWQEPGAPSEQKQVPAGNQPSQANPDSET